MIYLYKYTFPNGKSYIGVTRCLKRRHSAHERSDTVIGRALRKYVAYSFQVLCVCPDYQYAYTLEEKAIRAFGTMLPHGYNVAVGGEGGQSAHEYVFTPEHRAKLSQSRKGRQPFLGGKHSEETRAKMRAAHALRRSKASAQASVCDKIAIF